MFNAGSHFGEPLGALAAGETFAPEFGTGEAPDEL